MDSFAFVSDFDGTLTHRDFYHIIIEKYLKDWGKTFYEEWKKKQKINVEFLNRVFGSMGKSEGEIREEILKIPLDENAAGFIKRIKASGGDFYILSAGTSYYIDMLLADKHITDVNVISMKGVYKDGGIRIIPDINSCYYSEVFGLDKRKVVEHLKTQYTHVFFAGDSEPDLEAAKIADVTFAKGELIDLLGKENRNFVPFGHYKEVEDYMIEKRWLK